MAFFSQIADAFTLCSQPPAERPVRTTADPPMAPEDALKLLKDMGWWMDVDMVVIWISLGWWVDEFRCIVGWFLCPCSQH